MRKNDRMRMSRLAPTLPPHLQLTMALLLSAAGFSAFAQATDAASAPESAASVADITDPPAVKSRPLAKVVPPAVLSVPPATWAGLTPKQQALLAPLERDWPEISDVQRSKWLSATPTLATMSGEEIKRVHDRIRDWTMLSGSERLNARISFQVSRQLTPEQRQARWEAYQALPEEERKALAEKAMARRQALAEAPARTAKPKVSKSAVPTPPPQVVIPTLVTSTLVQAKPGATTVLISREVAQARKTHTAPNGATDTIRVDPQTLLPRIVKSAASSR